MSVSIVTVATIKFSVESIVTIDTIVTELKKKYYEAKENIDFTRFLGNMYKEKNKSVSIVTVVTIKFSVESIVTIDATVTRLKKDYYKTKENIDFIRFLGSI